VQGTAEGVAFSREEMDAMLNLAAAGIGEITVAQKSSLVD
jgi:ribonuclease PH